MPEVVRYFNQHRHMTQPKPGDWGDSCYGHETLYDAIGCMDGQKEFMDSAGGMALVTIPEIIAMAVAGMAPKPYPVEFRVVKRTTVEEVLDGVGAPIQSVKEG